VNILRLDGPITTVANTIVKNLVFAKNDFTLESLKKQLGIPLGNKDYLLFVFNNAEHAYVPLNSDKDLSLITHNCKLKIELKKSRSLEEKERLISEKKVENIVDQASSREARQKELKGLYCDPFTGGKVFLNDETWIYDADGSVYPKGENDEESPIRFVWNGYFLLPAENYKSVGAGEFNGQNLSWYAKENQVYKTSGKKEVTVAYVYEESKKAYSPVTKGSGQLVWKSDGQILKPENATNNQSVWLIDGSVPEPVVMLLQMMKYSDALASERKNRSDSLPRRDITIHASLSKGSLTANDKSLLSVVSLDPFAKEGYLLMKNNRMKKWKRKWLVLKEEGDELYTYKTQEDAAQNSSPKILHLADSSCFTTMKKDKYCIVIKLQPNSGSKSEIFQFLVDSRADRDSWTAAFLSHGAKKAGVIKEGVLKSRERYWFVLTTSCLQYYLRAEDALEGKPAKGEIDLFNCLVKETDLNVGSLGRRTEKSRFGFAIYQPNGKKYYLFAESLQESSEWMKALNDVVNLIKNQKARRNTVSMAADSAWEVEEEDFLDTNDYPFDEDDHPDNIRYVKEDAENEDLGTRPEDPPLIKGGTLSKLVEKVTPTEYSDTNYLMDFILTFRSFTTSRELLSLLIKRFSMPRPKKKLSDDETTAWETKKRVIRLRVINFIRMWLEHSWADFREDAELLDKLTDFINEKMARVEKAGAEQLTRVLKKKKEGIKDEVEESLADFPAPILPQKKNVISSTDYQLFDFDPLEMARQITLTDFEMIKNIPAIEFFDKNWTRRDKETLSPKLCATIKRFNDFGKWIATEIVSIENLKERAAMLSRWIEIAEKCNELQNYWSTMAIICALQSAGVFRLKQTWANVSSHLRESFERLKEFLSREGNSRTLRKHLKSLTPPSIPYLGIYLTDLVFIDDGNPNFLEGGLINFSKRRRVAKIIREIQYYQTTAYKLRPVPFIQNFILNGVGLEDEECYALSLALEESTAVGGALRKDQSAEIVATLKEKRISMRRRSLGQTNSSPNGSMSLTPMGSVSSSVSASFSGASTDINSKRARKMKELETKFYNAILAGDLEKVKSLIAQGLTLKGTTEAHSQTPLHVAAYGGHAELVKYFLTVKDQDIGNPEIDAKDKAGWTALHCAASPGHLAICEYLLEMGASPSATNNDKNTTLHFLARRNPLTTIISPKEFKKNKNKNQSPIVLEDSLYFKVMKTLIDKGASIDAQNNQGDTPLHQAVSAENEDGVKMLLKLRAAPHVTNSLGETPLQTAEKLQIAGIISLLREAERRGEKKNLMTRADLKLDDIASIVRLMKDNELGITLKDRKRLLISFKRSFDGEECVDWMLQRLPVRSREEAANLGQKLIENHFIQNISKSVKVFKDAKNAWYQFCTAEDVHQWKAKITSSRTEATSVNLNDFELIKIIGEGANGMIMVARKKDTKIVYSLKITDKDTLIEEGELEQLMGEKQVLQNDSPFLVHLHYAFQTDAHLFFVMDFIAGGDLGFHLKREERFPEPKVQFVAAELVLALEYLHSRGVVLRDLKPENILIDRDGHICLTDFTMSKILSDNNAMMQTAVGSPAYSAPEVLEGEPYTKSVDWWGLGVVTYQMLLGFTPFEFDDDFGKLIRSILTSRILYPEELVSTNARSLLEGLLQRNPRQRLDEPDEIKHHPFFDNIDWAALAVKKVASPFKIEMKSDDDVSYFDWKFTSKTFEPQMFHSQTSSFQKIPGFDYA